MAQLGLCKGGLPAVHLRQNLPEKTHGRLTIKHGQRHHGGHDLRVRAVER